MIKLATAAAEPGHETDAAKATQTEVEVPPAKPLPVPALIVFGTDKDGKPHASWFAEPDAALATKAAGVMKLRTLRLDSDDLRAIATELPAGRVFASGRAFVPFVKKGLFERLSALTGPVEATAPIAPAAGETAAQEPATATGEAGAQTLKPPAAGEPRYPRSWAGVALGSLVLVSEGEQDGWYEAEVIEAKAGGVFILRWRDWPELPLLVRRREHMALLHPNTAAVEAA